MKLTDEQTAFIFIGLFLICAYIHALWQFRDAAHIAISGLFGLAIFDLAYRKRIIQSIRFSFPSSLIGGLIIGLSVFYLVKAPSLVVSRLFPPVAGLGLIILGFGLRSTKGFSRELLLLGVLGIPELLFKVLPDLSPVTAFVASFLLRMAGFSTSHDGIRLSLNAETIQVFRECSGVNTMAYLLGISVICLLLFPLASRIRQYMPFIAMAIGFGVNAVRIAFLAYIHETGNSQAFDYWHTEEGAMLFGALAVGIFGLFYLHTLRQERKPSTPHLV